jgi:tetratricopeptide (TPR) repeat protein
MLVLSQAGFAQDIPVPSPQVFLPPAIRGPETGAAEPPPRPLAVSESDAPTSMEAELRQFRSELREFQLLREEVARSTKAADAESDRASAQQRQELLDLLTAIAKSGMTRRATAVPAPSRSPEASSTPPVVAIPLEPFNLDNSVDVADPFALGKVLFRSGDFAGAEKAFRKVPVTSENELTLKYLLATCLRRQSHWQAAMDAYKSVAESNQDPVLRDLAKWQLDNIRWHQQSESQLEKMRQQREKREKRLDVVSPQAANIGRAKSSP